jgi:hypothetical protein
MLEVEDVDLVGGRGKTYDEGDIEFRGLSLLPVAGHLRAVRPGFILRHVLINKKKYYIASEYIVDVVRLDQ